MLLVPMACTEHSHITKRRVACPQVINTHLRKTARDSHPTCSLPSLILEAMTMNVLAAFLLWVGTGQGQTILGPQELGSTGFSVSIWVGSTRTSVDVNAPANVWHGIGFGGLTMSANVEVVVWNGTDVLSKYTSPGSYHAEPSALDSNYWDLSFLRDNSDGTMSYSMSRDNDISAICSECYVFDPADLYMDIIMVHFPLPMNRYIMCTCSGSRWWLQRTDLWLAWTRKCGGILHHHRRADQAADQGADVQYGSRSDH